MELPSHFEGPVDGRFVIEHPVGEGAAGVVFRAFDLKRKRPVALKVFHSPADPSLEVGESAGERAAQAERDLLVGVRHSGVIEILEAGFSDQFGRAYLVLEWLDGRELNKHHQSSPLSPRYIVGIGVLVLRALGKIHSMGIVHRDLKPSNIMLRRRPPQGELLPDLEVEPVLIDFGIATKEPGAPFAGTPAYMSPEQARGDEVIDHRSDLYSLGATMFELLIGRPPHQGASPLATLARLATAPAPRLSSFRTDLPRGLDDAIDALLQTDAALRPKDATEAEHLLLGCLTEEPAEDFLETEASSRLGTGTTRLVTTVFAVGLSSGAAREHSLELIRESGANGVPLGKDAVIAHLGVTRATGDEARAALLLGKSLALAGAAVGIASGRARLESARKGPVRPVGEVVDRAATLAREASASEVLSDATTSELGRGRFRFKMRGDGSAFVGEALTSGSGEQSGGAPFVGRDAELAQILGAFDRAVTEGHSMVVSVCGPPGIGKSRLQKECVARFTTKAHPPRLIVQRNDAYGRRHILGAAADILRAMIELPRGATENEVHTAVVERLGPETMSELTRENQQLLAALLGGSQPPQGFDPGGSRDALWLAMTDLVTRVLSNETVVVVTEDLQWADSESVAWLEHLLGRSSRNPLFLLSCVRPEFFLGKDERFGNRDHLRVDLRPISSNAVRVIAEAVLGDRATPEHLDGISERAGGSPLFAEELARLAAAGRHATKAPTIEAAIQASLDSLEDGPREALGKLSVLGLSCWDKALEAFGDKDSEEIMRALVGKDFLVEQSASRFPDCREFAFKHALVRDVAYSSLEENHRTVLHAMGGRWLSEMGEDAATVAGQLDLGGEHHLAATYWERAARRALGANALADALNMAERALDFSDSNEDSFRRASYLDEAYSRIDPRAADRETAVSALESSAYDNASRVLARAARVRFDDARGSGVDVSQRLAEVRNLAAELSLTEEVARLTAALASRAAYAGDLEVAEQEAQRLLDLSLRRVSGARVDAYQTLAIIRQARGAVSASIEERKSAVTAAREAGLREREAMLTTNLGFALSTVGARKEAREALERGLLLAEHIGSPAATRHAQMNLLGWAGLFGTDRRLDTFLTDTRAEADAAATGYWASPDRSNLGVLYYRGVELLRSGTEQAKVRATALLKMSAESYREQQHRDVLPVALGMWAEAERLSGNLARAAELGGEAAELLLSGAPSLLNESPVFLTLHKARLALGDEDGAKDALAHSIRPLIRRLNGLVGSPYAFTFLTQIPQNAELISATDAAGLLPESVSRVLAQSSG